MCNSPQLGLPARTLSLSVRNSLFHNLLQDVNARSKPLTLAVRGWPVSRILSRGLLPLDGHSSARRIAAAMLLPTRFVTFRTRNAVAPRTNPIRHCSRWGLPCHFRCRKRGGPLPHRFTLTRLGGLFSVALSLELPRPGVTRHRCPNGVRTFLTEISVRPSSHPRKQNLLAARLPVKRSSCQNDSTIPLCPPCLPHITGHLSKGQIAFEKP